MNFQCFIFFVYQFQNPNTMFCISKFEGECEGKKIEKKNKKKKIEVNKLFLYTTLNSLYLFYSSI